MDLLQQKAELAALSAVRRLAPKGSKVARFVDDTYRDRLRRAPSRHTDEHSVEHRARNFVHLSARSRPGPRVGIFMKGGCDLPAVFTAVPRIRSRLSGTCCIYNEGIGISDARPDILLQTLDGVPSDPLPEVVRPRGLAALRAAARPGSGPRIQLSPDYFRPVLFEPTFTVPRQAQLGEFPKSVVVLTVGPAYARSVYRHRRHGYLVDPGGMWLNESMEKVLADLDTAKWFKENFESLGRMSPEVFFETFGRVVRLVKERTGAHVLVFNVLVVEPGSRLHNYQFARNNPSLRRRDFDLAMRSLSAELDFHIVDTDRVLKREGISGQLDYAHFPNAKLAPVGAEVDRILQELEVV